MSKILYLMMFLFVISMPDTSAQTKEKATIRLTEQNLMHEMRKTSLPLNNAIVSDRKVSFQWPLPKDLSDREKGGIRYRLRYAKSPSFAGDIIETETRWPFFNPDENLTPGKWYWQYGYITEGKTDWSEILCFTVKDNPETFCPPSLKILQAKIPQYHPRVVLDRNEWESIRKRSEGTDDRKSFMSRACKILAVPMKSVDDINTHLAKGLKNEKQREAMLTRESRRIIDAEESNTDILIRAYLLTKDEHYADEAIKRVMKIITWGDSEKVVGDFNDATLLSIASQAYDVFYDRLDEKLRRDLLNCIQKYGSEMYQHYQNNLENHIADNHVWQMTLRIFTMAAFSVYGELPEASEWVDYCYNVWVARFPGLNKDGGWHNGDSYFHVNIRTLVEVPYLYTRLTGFNFFDDPWYQGSVNYVIYQQPPFSKSGGNGSSHQNVLTPSGPRVSYADAIAKLTGNSYAADYVRIIRAKQPEILQQYCISKAGGLAWFRMQCHKPLPSGMGLKDMPMGCIFPQTGLASFSTDLSNTPNSAMLSFRSSPYGSTSHAIANQNAFNTFWAGEPLFYSSGHHISFVDRHSVYCHRATRAHNSILVNGMGQRIGTEGYGWIPRYYVSDKISYVLGDASNAYGKVISPLWLKRGEQNDVDYSPENGWDETGLKTFRRHIITLGSSGYTFIYDELEASEPVTWSYLLHTITNPMEMNKAKDYVHVRAVSKHGQSDAYIYAPGELKTDTTSRFFVEPVNWLRADADGNFKKYPNHWHFTATSDKQVVYRFATIVYTHAKDGVEEAEFAPRLLKNGSWQVDDWNIQANVSIQGVPSFEVRNTGKGNEASITYKDGGETVVSDGKRTVRLRDQVPELEI